MRNLKMLGLAALSMLALGAMFASAASAQNPGQLTAGLTPSTHTATPIYGTQYGGITENDFVAFEQGVTCTNSGVSFTGQASGTDKTLTITPTYEDCYVFGGENHEFQNPATVTMNGCDYLFNQPHSKEGSHTTWTGTVDLVCPTPETRVEIHVYTGNIHEHSGFSVCTETLPGQKGIGTVEYHNVDGGANPDDITVTVRAKGIKATKHGICGPDEELNAEYTSNVTLTSGEPGKPGNDDLWFTTE